MAQLVERNTINIKVECSNHSRGLMNDSSTSIFINQLSSNNISSDDKKILIDSTGFKAINNKEERNMAKGFLQEDIKKTVIG
jgi:hypothetical protein